MDHYDSIDPVGESRKISKSSFILDLGGNQSRFSDGVVVIDPQQLRGRKGQ